MLIIPERNAIVIMPPRTGSTALKRAVLDKYEHAFSPYRHGEFNMTRYIDPQKCPTESDVENWWEDYFVYYIVRDPVDRLVSLWRYMHEVSYERNYHAPKEWVDRVKADADRPFSEWVLNSTELFNESKASPVDGSPESHYCTFENVPAARKSARQFLRGVPDYCLFPVRFLHKYDYMGIGVDVPPQENSSNDMPADITQEAIDFIELHHAADTVLRTIAE